MTHAVLSDTIKETLSFRGFISVAVHLLPAVGYPDRQTECAIICDTFRSTTDNGHSLLDVSRVRSTYCDKRQ